ncbi:MAG: hypothetical protein Fur0023_01780 [Bacteroidia bacterium]
MKTKSILLLILGWMIHQTSFAQGIRNESAVITNSAASIYIATAGSGHYTSNGTGRIAPVGTASMFVYGDWTNNASNSGFTADAGTVYMDGNNQTIGGTSSTTFYNLTLRGGGVKTLGINTYVGGASTTTGLLNLTDRELNLNQYTLTITNPNMTIAYTTGYINSENGVGTSNVYASAVTWSNVPNISRTIPFGVSSTQIPFTFNKTAGPNVNITFSTRTSSGGANNTPIPSTVTAMNVPAISVTQANDGSNTVIDRWWYITPNTTSATPVTLDLNFYYRGSENTCTGCPQTGNFGAQYWVEYSATNKGWKPCAGPTWTCSTMGTWPGVTAGTQNATTSTGAVTLPDGGNATSYWVLSCSQKPLPIELVSFNAVCQNNGANLIKWTTATEVNADKFEIQKSNNAVDFQTIGTIQAQYPYGGNYSYTDNTKNAGITYYRLKMIDKDASFKYSDIINVDNNQCKNIRTQVYAYGKNIVVNVNTSSNQTMRALVYDAIGRTLLDKPIEVNEGNNTFQWPMEVAQSIYFVKLVDERGDLVQVQKVVISE